MLDAKVIRIQSHFAASQHPASYVVVVNEYCKPFIESKRAFLEWVDSQVIQPPESSLSVVSNPQMPVLSNQQTSLQRQYREA